MGFEICFPIRNVYFRIAMSGILIDILILQSNLNYKINQFNNQSFGNRREESRNISNMKNMFGDNHGLDEKSVDFISKAIEKANLPGFDYVEFKQALSNIAKMNIDEAIAFKTAFGTAMTMGLTKEKLLETATHYRNVVSKEKEQFDIASQKQKDLKIGENLKLVDEMNKKILDNELKIKQLQDEIDQMKVKVRGMDYEREQAYGKIEEAKTKFNFAHQSIMNQIEKDIENIQKYI